MSLEQWAQQHFAGGAQSRGRRLSFAPRHAPRPYQYHNLPVALLVVTSSSPVRSGLLSAVRLLQEATYRFRLVLVTDDPGAPVLGDVEWPVEHIMSEDDWHQVSAANWLPVAADQLRWIHHQFGASVLYAPTTLAQVAAAVRDLVTRCNAPQRVARAAIELVEAQQEDHDVSARGLRGWWQQVPRGRASYSVLAGRTPLTITTNRGPRSGVLISAAASSTHQAVLNLARKHGWNTASIEPESSIPPPETLMRAVRAARDGLTSTSTGPSTGPVLLIDDADPLDAPGTEGTDGVIHTPAAGPAHTLRMNYGASLDFRSEELPMILEGIEHVHRGGSAQARTADHEIAYSS